MRRGATLVEALVLVAVLGVALALLQLGGGAGAREGAQLEKTAGLVHSAVLLRQALGRDVLGSLPLEVLPEGQPAFGGDGTRMRLPVFREYDPDGTPALRYRVVEYRWEGGRLTRDGRALSLPEVRAVRFALVPDFPPELEVVLTREGSPPGAPDLVLRLPAPAGSGGGDAFRPAAHHAGASPSD